MGIIYFALGFSTFNNVLKVYYKAKEETGEILTILISLMVANFMILLQGVLTFLLVLCKAAVRSKAGFSYGFLTSSTANVGLLVLLVSLICSGFQTEVDTVFQLDPQNWELEWTSSDSATFKFTYYFGYVTAFLNLAFFGVMFFMSGAIGEVSTKDKIEADAD